MLHLQSFVVLLGVLLWTCVGVNAENVFNYEEQKNISRPYTMQVQRFLCIDAPYKETILHECRMIFRRNQRPLLNVSLEAPKKYNYLMIQFQLHYKFIKYQPFLIDIKAEGCDLMRDRKNDPTRHWLYGVMKDLMSSLVHRCPFGNRTYSGVVSVKEEIAPRSIPAGEYRMDGIFTSRTNVTLFSMQLFFEARRRGILKSMLEW
uniref:Uncharacterized protein n=1 Tax=Anopheles quadriannulatus TaxID=34691 RepID=A0A182XAK9_ANOQN